ncbi:hypothetical protein GCM10009765_14830 [Fodinicola feengrottensis]|uniref:AB hydrolase-1 domain-containing protein n=1 Tax=Fodinicola feengrottensis TaxID=435914 RepID=A0ABN2G6Z4_9ACTN
MLARRHGVSLRVCGQGPPVVVIPGMEGSGESCLDVVLPVVRTGIRVPVEAPGGLGGAFAGTPGRSPDAETGASGGRVILVDYSAERHRLLGQLVGTIAGLLRQVLPPDEPVVWWGQSFGNLLIALVRQRLDLAPGRAVLVSPFTGLPAVRVRIGHVAMALTPSSVYASTARPTGRLLFGPDPDDAGGPFFGALAAMHPLTVRRRMGWLAGQDFASAFLALRDPLGVWLGDRDRLVDLPRQLAFFSALARRPGDRLTVVGGCGHVVLPLQAMESVRTGVRDWLNLNPPSDARQQ